MDTPQLDSYELEDRYCREQGRVFLTGTQALVRLPMLQRLRDRRRGLNTAGFISGYRGSPLGAYDLELWRARRFLSEHDIEFLPAINEDLAATAILGTQQVETDAEREVDGVFSIWYGKGPGIDRAGDAGPSGEYRSALGPEDMRHDRSAATRAFQDFLARQGICTLGVG